MKVFGLYGHGDTLGLDSLPVARREVNLVVRMSGHIGR